MCKLHELEHDPLPKWVAGAIYFALLFGTLAAIAYFS